MIEPTIDDAFAAVCREYDTFETDDPEGKQQLAAIKEYIRSRYAESKRSVTNAAWACIAKYVKSEMDYSTPGNRGLGRMSDHVPRLAAKHRRVVSRMDAASLATLDFAIKQHILCAYLFVEWWCGLTRECERTLSANDLFEMWVPAIYLPPWNMDPQSQDESDVKTIWFASTGKAIRDILQHAGVTWDASDAMGTDQAILTHYFTGGMVLRALEAMPLSKSQQLDVATAGGYSAERKNS